MALEVIMPKAGVDMTEGQILLPLSIFLKQIF